MLFYVHCLFVFFKLCFKSLSLLLYVFKRIYFGPFNGLTLKFLFMVYIFSVPFFLLVVYIQLFYYKKKNTYIFCHYMRKWIFTSVIAMTFATLINCLGEMGLEKKSPTTRKIVG